RRIAAAVLLCALAIPVFADDAKVSLTITALQATDEGRPEKVFDPGLEAIKKSVSKLKYDTFKKLKLAETDAKMGEESKIVLTDRYTLIATPQKKDADGRVHIAFRIEEKAGDKDKSNKTVVALQFTVASAAGSNIV